MAGQHERRQQREPGAAQFAPEPHGPHQRHDRVKELSASAPSAPKRVAGAADDAIAADLNRQMTDGAGWLGDAHEERHSSSDARDRRFPSAWRELSGQCDLDPRLVTRRARRPLRRCPSFRQPSISAPNLCRRVPRPPARGQERAQTRSAAVCSEFDIELVRPSPPSSTTCSPAAASRSIVSSTLNCASKSLLQTPWAASASAPAPNQYLRAKRPDNETQSKTTREHNPSLQVLPSHQLHRCRGPIPKFNRYN